MQHTRAKLTLTDIKDDGVGFKRGSCSELRNPPPPDLVQWACGQWSAFTSMLRDCSTDGWFCLFWKWSLKPHQDPHDVDQWLHGCQGLGYHTSAWSSTWGQNSHQWLNPLSPIKYRERHLLFIDSRDRYVTMVLWSEQGPCEVEEDSIEWRELAKAEEFGKQVQAEDRQKVKFGRSSFVLVNPEFFALIQTFFAIRLGFKPVDRCGYHQASILHQGAGGDNAGSPGKILPRP